MSLLAYFRYPFPSREGFSAYRTPGLAVHGPVMLAAVFAGFMLCWPHPVLRPFLVVWALAGIYLGRDIAVLSHYNPLLTLISWAAFGWLIFKPGPIARFGASHVLMPAVFSAAVGAVLLLVAFIATRHVDRSRPEGSKT